MKQKFLIAAGLLCLGTSPALAFAIAPMAPDMAKAVKAVWADQMAADAAGSALPATSGPSEAVLQPASLPAAAAYPPCRRGAGDDHCIQLYERGVRAQLAAWNRSASGSETAMGGPYEPVDSTLAGELGGSSLGPTDGDGAIDSAAGETADAAAPVGAQYTGVGGPLEEVDYPPCSRTITDRCIQLYERGVHR